MSKPSSRLYQPEELRDRAEQAEADGPRCKSCGIPYDQHLGIQGICAKLKRLRDGLRIIRTWAAVEAKYSTIESAKWLEDIRDKCDDLLSE